MRRRDLFRGLLGLAGAIAAPVAFAESLTTSKTDEFISNEQMYCPECNMAMYPERVGATFNYLFTCCNGPRDYGGVPFEGCPRFGIKYRARKVHMERV